jgi:hypothetical protein
LGDALKCLKKVVVVGNCQARPIATLLEKMSDEIEVTKVAIVHLLKSEQDDESAHLFLKRLIILLPSLLMIVIRVSL